MIRTEIGLDKEYKKDILQLIKMGYTQKEAEELLVVYKVPGKIK